MNVNAPSLCLVPEEDKEGIGSPGILVTDCYKTPCASGEPNPGPLQDQQVFLTAEPSLQPK